MDPKCDITTIYEILHNINYQYKDVAKAMAFSEFVCSLFFSFKFMTDLCGILIE